MKNAASPLGISVMCICDRINELNGCLVAAIDADGGAHNKYYQIGFVFVILDWENRECVLASWLIIIIIVFFLFHKMTHPLSRLHEQFVSLW